MIKKCFYLAAIIFLFLNYNISAQYLRQLSYPVAYTALQNENYHSSYLKPTALIIPGTLLLYGGLKPAIKSIQQLDDDILADLKKNHAGFHTHIDNYLMWLPSASVYALDAFKTNTAHSFKDHLLLEAGTLVITGGIGLAMRKISGNIKEYKTHNTKFPSGHTANAFRGAEIFHQELKENNELLSYAGYLAATSVGVLRIYNKVHLLTEVLAGAGLGIVSTKITYWIFDKTKPAKSNIDLKKM